jgi:hypothetical protein
LQKGKKKTFFLSLDEERRKALGKLAIQKVIELCLNGFFWGIERQGKKNDSRQTEGSIKYVSESWQTDFSGGALIKIQKNCLDHHDKMSWLIKS